MLENMLVFLLLAASVTLPCVSVPSPQPHTESPVSVRFVVTFHGIDSYIHHDSANTDASPGVKDLCMGLCRWHPAGKHRSDLKFVSESEVPILLCRRPTYHFCPTF